MYIQLYPSTSCRKIYFIVTCLLFLNLSLIAQNPRYNATIKRVEDNGEFKSQKALCVAEDKNGFIWIGSRDGLFRYDGQAYLHFNTKNGLRGKNIINLTPDENNCLLITYGGLGEANNSDQLKDVIDCSTFKIKTLTNYYPKLPFPEDDIRSIAQTNNTLHFTLRKSLSNYTYTARSGFRKINRKKIIQQIDISETGQINTTAFNTHSEQIQAKYAMYLYDDSTLEVSLYHHHYATQRKVFYPVARKSTGYLTYFKSVNPKYNAYYFIGFDGSVKKTPTPIAFQNIDIASFYSCNNSENTFITDTQGTIFFFENTLDPIKIVPKKPSAHIVSYYKTKNGMYWFCTSEGIVTVQVNQQLFANYFNTYQRDNNARGIYVSKTYSFFNLGNYGAFIQNKDTTIHERINPIALCAIDNELWVGGVFLAQYDFTTRQEITKSAVNENTSIWSIAPLNESQLLLGLTEDFNIYDRKTQCTLKIKKNNFPLAQFVYKIFLNSKNQIWAIADNGLYVFNATGEITDYYSNTSIQPNKHLPCPSIHDIYEDKNGTYWIASNGMGLFKWEKEKNKFTQYDSNKGFLSNVLYCIQEDKHENLWISTYNGLVKFNKKTEQVKIFTEKDGISNNEFNRTSSFKDADGMMYFGSINGITVFDPENFTSINEKNTYPFCITQHKLFNKKTNQIENKQDVVSLQKIDLYDHIAYFDLDYALLDYSQRIYTYAYLLEGLDKEWIFTSSNTLHLSNLPYGNYTLKIKAQNANGEWNPQEISIAIHVIAPFYKTTWFLWLLIIVGLVLILVLIRLRLRHLQKRNRFLESKILEHTAQLRQEKRELEKSNEIIKNQNKEKDILIQEVHHRVKNNLQLVAAMLELQTDLNDNEIIQQALKTSSRRINAMSLVHEMLYNEDKFEAISLKKYLTDLSEKLTLILNSENFFVKFVMHIDDVFFNINNCVAIGMITSEIISNAFKYAFKNSENPSIYIDLKYDTANQIITYSIRDNGNGADIKNIKQGLGMKLVDIFSRQLKSTYEIKNNTGLSYTFIIPVQKNEK
ncbi:MAG: histidine kinase dimerization/phosphoacceptor domain -containing protein [Bacteroidia bacterium]